MTGTFNSYTADCLRRIADQLEKRNIELVSVERDVSGYETKAGLPVSQVLDIRLFNSYLFVDDDDERIAQANDVFVAMAKALEVEQTCPDLPPSLSTPGSKEQDDL